MDLKVLSYAFGKVLIYHKTTKLFHVYMLSSVPNLNFFVFPRRPESQDDERFSQTSSSESGFGRRRQPGFRRRPATTEAPAVSILEQVGVIQNKIGNTHFMF